MAILTKTNISQKALDNPASKSIINTMLYSDIFKYPLTEKEIFDRLSDKNITKEAIKLALDALCSEEIIFRNGLFYAISNNNEVFESRIHKNRLAKKYLKRGRKISRFIFLFPFVRGVFLSGSISKDCMEEDGDIDYFIITAPNRLWLARTLLISFKKIFLLNSYKFFCLNYFIDTNHMEIEEKNMYTATEIVTLIPTSGKECCESFLASNNWAKDYKPNFPIRDLEEVSGSKSNWFKQFMEWILNGRIGRFLDKYFQNISVSFWKKKFKHFEPKEFDHAIKSKDYVSKAHPNNFQKLVLEAFEKKTTAFEKKYAVNLKGL